jgi:hypothetical protein
MGFLEIDTINAYLSSRLPQWRAYALRAQELWFESPSSLVSQAGLLAPVVVHAMTSLTWWGGFLLHKRVETKNSQRPAHL